MNDKYDFLKEQVKKQKPYIKWLNRAGAAAFSGLIFSVVVLLVMVFVYPRLDRAVNPKDAQQVDLGMNSSQNGNNGQSGDDPEESKAEESKTEENSQAAESEAVQSELEENNSQVQSSVLPEEKGDPDTSVAVQELVVEKTTAENLDKISADIMEVAKTVEKSMVMVIGVTEDKDWFNQTYENQGQLSGLIVAFQNSAYYILTEYRVVKDVNRIMVTFSDGNTAEARFVKRDTAIGMAVIRVDANDVPKSTRQTIAPVEMKRHTMAKKGETVLAIGSPMGYMDAVAAGMVTSVDNLKSVTDNAYHILYTDIPVSEDGSGILVDMDGGIVGIMAQQLLDTRKLGMMTCLPFSELVESIEKLCNNEKMVYLGINGQDISTTVSEKTGIPKGVWVDSVDNDSPAMETGIQAGDVIVKIGDAQISTLKSLHSLLNQNKPGDKITLYVMRQSVEGYVEVPFEVTVSGR